MSGADERPVAWLAEQLGTLPADNFIPRLHRLFADTMLCVINLSLRGLGATLNRRADPLEVGKESLCEVVEAKICNEEAIDFGRQDDSKYDYLLLYLKDVFSSVVCAYYFSEKNNLQAILQLTYNLVEGAAFFLQEEGGIGQLWASMNQHAMALVTAYFPPHYELKTLFKEIFPRIQPYLALHPDRLKPLSLLTLGEDGDAYLNVPVAPEPEAPDTQVPSEYPTRLEEVMSRLANDRCSSTMMPMNSQESSSGLPRNTRIQLTGELRDCFVAKRVYAQMATPILPANFFKAIAHIFFGYRPRNSVELMERCRKYVSTAKAMFDRELSRFFNTPEEGWEYVYVHLVTDVFPPEPTAIEIMQELRLLNWNYVNAPFKDFQRFGMSRVDFSLDSRVLAVLSRVGAGGLNGAFTLLIARIDNFEKTRNRSGMVAGLLSLLQATLNPSEARPMQSLLAWFYIMLLEHRYSKMRRVDRSSVWQACIHDAYAKLKRDERNQIKKKWNVFVHMVPQIGAVSALFALIIECSGKFKGVEGCKSAKDRATEVMLFKLFAYGIVFEKTAAEIEKKLRPCLVHGLVFLMLYGHVPGTMDRGGYADTRKLDPENYPGARETLELSNRYIRALRSKAAKYRASIFADKGPKFRKGWEQVPLQRLQ